MFYSNYTEDVLSAEVTPTPTQHAPVEKLTDVVIQDKLGEGNFGEVYLGTWQGSPVALKSVSDVLELRREIDILKSMNHPNIIRYFGIYERQDEAYLVMELLSLGSLNTYLQREQNNLTTLDLIAM
jgi:serine/threonine protein kinase